ELEDRVRRILAFNTYDYPEGVSRANRTASIYVGGARLPGIGPVVTKMENKPALGVVLRGGLADGSKLPDHYLAELRRVGRRRGYPPRGARGLPQCGQHDRRPSTLRSRHRPRRFDLRRSRLVANPRARSQPVSATGRSLDCASSHRTLRRPGAARPRRWDSPRQPLGLTRLRKAFQSASAWRPRCSASLGANTHVYESVSLSASCRRDRGSRALRPRPRPKPALTTPGGRPDSRRQTAMSLAVGSGL